MVVLEETTIPASLRLVSSAFTNLVKVSVKFVLHFVLGRGVDRGGFFAPALAAFGFTLGLLLVAVALFVFRLGAGLGFQTRFRLPDLRQPLLTPLQFVGEAWVRGGMGSGRHGPGRPG